MFKFVLIDIFNSGTYGQRVLSKYLRERDIEVFNIMSDHFIQDTDTDLKVVINAIRDLAVSLRPDLIGVSITTVFSHRFYMDLIKAIKKETNVPIVAGGPYPTTAYARILEEGLAEYVCVGEGEESALELCRKISAGGKTGRIPGIVSKNDLVLIPRDPPQDLDALPFPDIGGRNMFFVSSGGRVVNEDVLLHRPLYPAKFSRGCVFNCSYCYNSELRNLYSKTSKYYRVRSVRHIIGELLERKRLNNKMKRLIVFDDTFPFNEDWLEEFSAEYRSKIGLPFILWTNPNTINEKRVRLLKEAGAEMFMVGVQSGSYRTRSEVFSRYEKDSELITTDNIMSRYGISKKYDFIIDHPWEGKTELRDIYDLLKKFKPPFRVNMHSLALFEGTKLEQRAVDEGLIDRDANRRDLVCNSFDVSRKMQWVRGDPSRMDTEKKYWINLIYLTGKAPLPLACVLARPLFRDILPGSNTRMSLFNVFCGLFRSLNTMITMPAKLSAMMGMGITYLKLHGFKAACKRAVVEIKWRE